MREQIKYDIEKALNITVKCDEENNPPDIVYNGCVMAKLMWKEYPSAVEYKYINLVFGNPWDINKIKN